ncbi:class I SAM-dependent methyltransferase [Reyranella sp.]|uniref:class I SAM-dependent methyltransferase n=1 Tax=Reyranella sp. TaxID=1929291 RepID=UPI003BABA9FA
MSSGPILPYFDFILALLAQKNRAVETSFGRHVHFGYWAEPDRAADDDEGFARAAEQLSLELCRLAGIASGDRVLDAGCGFGGTLALLNDHYRDLRLVGLNLESRQLDRARQLVRPANGNLLELQQGDACALPFADGSFDRVLAVECIFHFPSRETFLREAFRVLRPGGTLALSDFVPSTLFRPVARLATESRHLARFQYFGRCDIGCTVRGYRRLAREIGFESLAERDATRNVLPTWGYLKVLLGQAARIEGITGPVVQFMDVLRIVSRLGLLNYYLIGLRKPIDAAQAAPASPKSG